MHAENILNKEMVQQEAQHHHEEEEEDHAHSCGVSSSSSTTTSTNCSSTSMTIEQHPNSANERTTIPCKYFMNGFCKNGDQCSFYHPQSPNSFMFFYQQMLLNAPPCHESPQQQQQQQQRMMYIMTPIPQPIAWMSSTYDHHSSNMFHSSSSNLYYNPHLTTQPYFFNSYPSTITTNPQQQSHPHNRHFAQRRSIQSSPSHSHPHHAKSNTNSAATNISMYSEIFEDGEDEPSFYQPKVCTFYVSGKGCKYGYHCKFFHPSTSKCVSTNETSSSQRLNTFNASGRTHSEHGYHYSNTNRSSSLHA
ncbi:hypothetical protein C9374_013593 [Naegleria lovaniensis]|uniref:C3H1-type domain-containing protein n=1 Tax=Naegleria lovaniensis TaxID=51637 RepID=A0AA88KNH6_NAELO|nr:uncharacterized protein C9374_013593 [Naegleria lovaniensis]KAG2392108.1 hypothetical protein C9374_013593 [Naegleria lovaniensis]